jgi:hypothetical protein
MLTRRRSIGRVDWTVVPIHPIGLAAFPVLFLFAENAVQQISLRPLWAPLGLSLLGAVAAFLLCAAALRDWLRGALLASLLIALFFSFGHAWNLVAPVVANRWYLAAAYLLIALLLGFAIWRGGSWVRPLTTVLNVAILFLVVFNAVRIADFATGAQASTSGAAPTPAVSLDASAPKRDIYYIILDRYANAETLEAYYGHDNRPFLDALETRGFTVADDAWANYWKTGFSLMASLSMDFIDSERFDLDDPPSFQPLYQALHERLPVPSTLKALGYEYVHLGNIWPPTSTNVDADITRRFEEITEFEAALEATTVLSLLSRPPSPDADTETVEKPELARQTSLGAFRWLEEAADRAGPTFVFAHILLPHPPYVFNADGSMPSEEEAASRTEEEKYVQQLTWTNNRVLQAIDVLLDAPSGQEPIILLQADEGPFPTRFRQNQRTFNWLEATPDEIQIKFGILNALHLPGVDDAAAGVSSTTSPVNEFRIVLNAYFGADLALLPDQTYLSPDYARMYDFVPYERPD